MTAATDVAIIGAGPYGLSIAAHLRAHGIAFRIFGSAVQRWRENMPESMLLKSEVFASNIYDPIDLFTLKHFCAEQGLPYADIALAVPRSTFGAYGIEFQKRLVPELEDRSVVAISQSQSGFTVRLIDGMVVTARRVVVATGLTYFEHIPDSLSYLPRELVSHSADYGDVSHFKDQHVAVIGGGSSALDLAIELQDAGADVRVITRRSSIAFNPYVSPHRSVWKRIRYPISGIGFGLRSRFYTDAPMAFHFLPEAMRLRIVRNYLGPSGGYHLRDRVLEKVPFMLGFTPVHAEADGRGVRLALLHADGHTQELVADHIVAATGYRVDLRRIPFLSDGLREQILSVEQSPILSRFFESSVRRLHFVGLASANSFGPMMRFMVGARYTARRLTNHLANRESQAASRP